MPIPFIFGASRLSRIILSFNRLLVKVRPTLFGFQILLVARPRPTLATLLASAKASAGEKMSNISNQVSTIPRATQDAELTPS